MSTASRLARFPREIMQMILAHLPVSDLARTERVSKLLQVLALAEIERRVTAGPLKDDWVVMIHLGKTMAVPCRFDPVSKQAHYSVPMDPVEIKTMFDHKRQIHCSLLQRTSSTVSDTTTSRPRYRLRDEFIIPVEKGMVQGETVKIDASSKLCKVSVDLTRAAHPLINDMASQQQKKLSLAPQPLTYTLQVTQMCLPLSTIAAC